MTQPQPQLQDHPWQDPVPGRLAYGVTILVALAVLTPYLWVVPKDNMQLITQAQTALISGWTMIIVFYFKQRSDAVKDQTIANQAATAQTAGAALAAATTPAEAIPIASGEVKTVVGTPPE